MSEQEFSYQFDDKNENLKDQNKEILKELSVIHRLDLLFIFAFLGEVIESNNFAVTNLIVIF